MIQKISKIMSQILRRIILPKLKDYLRSYTF